MRLSRLPRWKLTDSCGCPHPPGTWRLGCGHAPRPRLAAPGKKPPLAVVGGTEGGANTRMYPPPPPVTSPIAGLIDTHVHSSPDVFSRAMDDEMMAALYKERGVEAVVLKNHVTATADRAWFVRKHVPGFQVFGGVVLNSPVGGINPDAVEWLWRMQGGHGRVVWFPTFDADNHIRRFTDGPGGIKVLDDQGEVLPAVRAVLKVCAAQKLVVQTGHLSAAEALKVIAAGREMGVDRLVVTHAQFEVVNMTLDEMRQAAAMGAKLELCSIGTLMGPEAQYEWMRHWRRVKAQETVAAVRAIGAQHFVLATDLGQLGNPSPADGLQMFVAELMQEGITKDEIRLMGREVTGALLMG